MRYLHSQLGITKILIKICGLSSTLNTITCSIGLSVCVHFSIVKPALFYMIPYQKEMGKYCTQLERFGITSHGNLSNQRRDNKDSTEFK